MDGNWWWCYRVEQPEDVDRALELFCARFGKNPLRARISRKADAALTQALRRRGLEVETAAILPWDVWLTAEAAESEVA